MKVSNTLISVGFFLFFFFFSSQAPVKAVPGFLPGRRPRPPLGPSAPLPCQCLDLRDVPLFLLGHLLLQRVDLLPERSGMLHLTVEQVPQRPGKRGPDPFRCRRQRPLGPLHQNTAVYASPNPSVFSRGPRKLESRVRVFTEIPNSA